jgi:hypothetical protein
VAYNSAGRRVNCSLQCQPAFTSKTPIDVSTWCRYAADLLAKPLFQCGSPRHQLETEPIVDHRKTARTQRETLAVDTGDMFALDGRTVGKSGLGGNPCRGGAHIPFPQRIQQISGEDDPLSLSASEPFAGKMFEATIHRLPNLRAKSTSAQGSFLCKKLAVDPGRAWCCDLRFDRQIGSRRERRAFALKQMLSAIEEGGHTRGMTERMRELEAREDVLKGLLADEPADIPDIRHLSKEGRAADGSAQYPGGPQ